MSVHELETNGDHDQQPTLATAHVLEPVAAPIFPRRAAPEPILTSATMATVDPLEAFTQSLQSKVYIDCNHYVFIISNVLFLLFARFS